MSRFLPGFDFFSIGVNYWSSHAGMSMWWNFSAAEVEADFAALHSVGVNTARVFPLWSDFQNIHLACGICNNMREFAFADGSPLPAEGIRSYGIDGEMIKRFRIVADLAEKYEIKLIVAILTGWMSGAMFIPPALSGKNLLTDPLALRVENMFIRGLVGALKDHPAILAWEPGNECNCLSDCNADESWNWLHMVTSSIRLADQSRPVYSGMHGSSDYRNRAFNLLIHKELCDAVTVHPYPAFTAHCGKSALNDIPAIFHAPAESLYYRGVSGKTAFVEEIGAFGESYLSDERTEQYLYTVLCSSWVHDLGSVLWWCGFSFDRCPEQYPYRWCGMERNLGAFNSDRSMGGAARAMKRFSETALPELPPRRIDAVAVLTALPDSWKTAYGTFVLSKQAGFEVEYCNINVIDTLPESDFYLVPCIAGYDVTDLAKYQQLLSAAEKGATVVFTYDGGYLQPFAKYFGCHVDYCSEKSSVVEFDLGGEHFALQENSTRKLIADSCTVAAADRSGNPVITVAEYGKGKLVMVNCAIENHALEEDNKLYKVYLKLAEIAGLTPEEKAPEIGVSFHGNCKVYINYADYPVDGMPGNSMKIEKV